MSTRELERVEVMGRVAKARLKLLDAAVILRLSYRQVKRLWRRYQEVASHPEFNQEETLWFGEGALRAYFSRRAPGRGRWDRG